MYWLLIAMLILFLAVCPNKIQRFVLNICRRDRWRAWLHPEQNLYNLHRSIADWADRKIPNRTCKGCYSKIESECLELGAELKEHTQLSYCPMDVDRSFSSLARSGELVEKILEETADIMIASMTFAYTFHPGFVTRLTDKILTKMEKNERRTWSNPDPVTGQIQHTTEG
jgi:NTP pyrophosphatase (non-canonical NTP hydrolase)